MSVEGEQSHIQKQSTQPCLTYDAYQNHILCQSKKHEIVADRVECPWILGRCLCESLYELSFITDQIFIMERCLS